ncbi:Cilia- and flagella-associated protein 251 [Lobulomyces angularis]|nr:Cilia- and flagella-associated protein 251 [Lobulomyces angularis]
MSAVDLNSVPDEKLGKTENLPNALDQIWSYGMTSNSFGSVHNISDSYRKGIFYASANTGIIFEHQTGKQHLLQGHCNAITATTVTSNKRWLVTADTGVNCMLIVWDTLPGLTTPVTTKKEGSSVALSTSASLNPLPIKTLFDPHPGGVLACVFTADNKYLITLGSNEPQTLSIWDWTQESDENVCTCTIQGSLQVSIEINPRNEGELMTTGPDAVNFFVWSKENGIKQHIPTLNSKDFKNNELEFTYSIFLPEVDEAISGTKDGDVVVWANKSLNNLSQTLETGKRATIKCVKLHTGAINFITSVSKKYILTGGEDGFVKVYDNHLRLLLWFERLKAGPIVSISFNNNNTSPDHDLPSQENILSDLDIPEFVVSTKHGKVLKLLKQNSTGSSVAAANLVQQALIKKSLSKGNSQNGTKTGAKAGLKKNKEEFTWNKEVNNGLNSEIEHTNIGSLGILHDGMISRELANTGNNENKTTSTKTTPNSASNTPSVKVLLEVQYEKITCLSCHPKKPVFITGGHSGLIQLWNYETKKLLGSRKFEEVKKVNKSKENGAKPNKEKKASEYNDIYESLSISCLAYSDSGSIIGVGFSNGFVKILDSRTLNDYYEILSTTNAPPQPPFPYPSKHEQKLNAEASKVKSYNGQKLSEAEKKNNLIQISKNAIIFLTFDVTEEYLAAGDDGFGVSIIHREPVVGELNTQEQSHNNSLDNTNLKKKSLNTSFSLSENNTDSFKKKEDIKMQWVLYGRNQAHFQNIVALMFIPKSDPSDEPVLISVSYDRNVAEYDVKNASISGGFALKSLNRIEQTAHPLAATFHPNFNREDEKVSASVPASAKAKLVEEKNINATTLNANSITETKDAQVKSEEENLNSQKLENEEALKKNRINTENFLLISSTDYKFKVYNATTKFCRKTVLGPLYGSPLTNICMIPPETHAKYFAFSTSEKVVGITKLPLDGNPNKFMGVIAHPNEVNETPTFDGEYLLTVGDATVNQWKIQKSSIEIQLSFQAAQSVLEPYLNLVDNTNLGKESPFYKEMEDYFYYAQLRSQGENSTTKRKILDRVQLDQVPYIFQAMGFYPTKIEIENLLNEVKFSLVEKNFNGLVNSVNFEDLIKLYVNHKPAKNYTEEELFRALDDCLEPGKKKNVVFGDEVGKVKVSKENEEITRDGLSALIELYGESFTEEEFKDSFAEILKSRRKYKGLMPDVFTKKEFVEKMLFLEKY